MLSTLWENVRKVGNRRKKSAAVSLFNTFTCILQFLDRLL